MHFSFSQILILSCFTVYLLGWVKSSPVMRQRRSDDGGPMEAVVEQLSQQVNTLNAEMAVLKAKTATLDKTAAFHALSSHNPVQTASHGAIILDHAVTNVGNAYNTLTGVFTAPVSGLYVFQATIMDYRLGSDRAYAAIYVDNSEMALALSDSGHGYRTQSAITATVHVNAGQQVYLKNIAGSVGEYYDGEPYTTFSGFLLKAD